jgi:hypothetical protein
MYGTEASTGLGGLAAQAPGGDQFMPAALAITSRSSGIVGSPGSMLRPGISTPSNPGLIAAPQVSPGGSSVETPPAQLAGGWRQILDFHNSPAPWILVLILLHYAWTHVGARRRGRAGAASV